MDTESSMSSKALAMADKNKAGSMYKKCSLQTGLPELLSPPFVKVREKKINLYSKLKFIFWILGNRNKTMLPMAHL